ncbi:hypothetical protein [Streptomyces sporangiiformans]|uniref:hypothetical protein n=1 Tax=Streptomyces sporangiiformans TaxID=2315329 RepID=UPI003B8A648E
MTDEVGVITGDLTLATTALPGGRAAATVQYTGAAEWYTLTGSPVPLRPANWPRSTTTLLSVSGREAG